MSIDVIAVTATGGLPLLARRAQVTTLASEGQQSVADNELSFSRLAALNGVNLFSRLNDANLLFCTTKDSSIRWKVFRGSLVLIAIIDNIPVINQNHLLMFLDTVFDSMVMMCGLNELLSQNTERLKRCLRLSYRLIDYLLNTFISNSLHRIPFITDTIEYSINGHNSLQTMQSLVESSAQLAQSSFCWLFINKKLVAGSQVFWNRLNSCKDALLITHLINSLSDTDLMQTKEMAIYLPENCPTSLSRLIVSQLSKGVVICLLCGEQPSIDVIDTEIIVPLMDSKLHSEKFSKYLTNEIQMSFTIDNNIMAFIIFRKDLKIFSTFGQMDDKMNVLMQSIDWQNSDKFESYSLNETFKSYTINSDISQICILFRFNISVNQMRLIANKTLNLLLRDKYIWPQI